MILRVCALCNDDEVNCTARLGRRMIGWLGASVDRCCYPGTGRTNSGLPAWRGKMWPPLRSPMQHCCWETNCSRTPTTWSTLKKKSAACPWLLEISYECWNQPLVQPVLDDEKVPCDPCLIDRIITRMLKGQVLHTFPAQQTWRWHAKSKRFAWLTLFFN